MEEFFDIDFAAENLRFGTLVFATVISLIWALLKRMYGRIVHYSYMRLGIKG